MSEDLKRASGLWLKDGKRGKYFSGEVRETIPAGSKVLIFRNDRRDSENSPEYSLYVVEPDQPPMQRAEPAGAPADVDSDIPF